MLRDLYSNLKVIGVKVAAPTDNTAVAGPIVDTRDYSSVVHVIATGTLVDADATFATTFAESDDSGMSGATAIAAADMQGSLSGASFVFSNDDSSYKIGASSLKRYQQVTVTPSANASAAPISIIALGVPLRRPAT